MFIDFRERGKEKVGGEREREKEKHRPAASHMHSDWGLNPQLTHDQGLNPQPFGVQDKAQATEPHQQGFPASVLK